MSDATKQTFVDNLIPHKIPVKKGIGQAPVNIALSKYWGKRDIELNLPTNSSLSISLPGLGTKTSLEWIKTHIDQTNHADTINLNNQTLKNDVPFSKRLSQFLDLFRPVTPGYFNVMTTNTVPTAAGLASSASGYAALVLALNDAFEWKLTNKSLSLLGRLGSGSASRSFFSGFSIWHEGKQSDGMDSFAEALPITWPEFCIGLVEIDLSEKPIGSTLGMQNTVNTCDLYSAWPAKANHDVIAIQKAIQKKDIEQVGKIAENNALTMHATMMATWPPIVYWQPESVQAMHKIWALRSKGVRVFFTMDAGPNLKLLFLETEKPAIKQAFPSIKFIQPFL